MITQSQPYLLVCRPQSPSTVALLAELQALGVAAVHLPLLDYEHIKLRARRCSAELAIFTSAEAVRAWRVGGGELLCEHIWAVGAATARQLAECGLSAQVPEPASSEGLFEALPADLSGQRLALIKGAGGRRLLARELRARGAVVQIVCTYRRRRRVVQSDELPQPWPPQLAWASSGAIVRALADIDTNLSLAVPSARVARLARLLGFANIYNVRSAENSRFLKFIQSIWTK